MMPAAILLDMICPDTPEDAISQEVRQIALESFSQFAPDAVEAMLTHAHNLLPSQLEVVRAVMRRCAAESLESARPSASELESTLAYSLAGARAVLAFVDPELYYFTLTDMRNRCCELGFDGISELLEPDSQHYVTLNGMIIEDAIVNYSFETPQYYEYLGENADALMPYAEILTGDTPVGQHRLYLPRIEVLLAGGSPALLDGIL
jgi:hypothetical protein